MGGPETTPTCRRDGPMPGGQGRPARLAALAILLFVLPASVGAQQRDIKDTLALAYSRSPELLGAQRALQATNEEIPIALQRFLPRVAGSASAGSGYQEGRTFRGQPGGDLRQRIRTLDLTLSQPLYDGEARPGLRAAEALVLRARAQLLQTEQFVLREAGSVHAAVVRDREIVRLREAFVQSLNRLATVTSRLVAVGDRTVGDLAQVRAQEARAASVLLQARSQLGASEATYFRAVNERASALAQPIFRYRVPRTNQEVVAAARADNARVSLLRIDQVLAREQANQSAGILQPRVELVLSGSVGRGVNFVRGVGTSAEGYADSASIMLQMSIPLYPGPGDYARLRQAREVVRQRIAEQADAADRAEEDATTAFVRLTTARQLIEVAGRVVQAQQLALQAIVSEITAQRRPLQDQLVAEQQLLDAQVELASARAEELISGFGLLTATGVLSARFLELPVPIFDPQQDYDATRWRVIGISRAENRR